MSGPPSPHFPQELFEAVRETLLDAPSPHGGKASRSQGLTGTPGSPPEGGHPGSQLRLGFGEALEEALERVEGEEAWLDPDRPGPANRARRHQSVALEAGEGLLHPRQR